MGCFNITGFASQLPIEGDDEVIAFVGVTNEIDLNCYPDGLINLFFAANIRQI
jgi:hypothetical protein